MLLTPNHFLLMLLLQEPSLSRWHRDNQKAIEEFFRPGGAPYIIKSAVLIIITSSVLIQFLAVR